MPPEIALIPSLGEALPLDLIRYEEFKIPGFPTGKAVGVSLGILSLRCHRPEKQVRRRRLESTWGCIPGPPELLSASAAGGTLIRDWDKPRPGSKLQRIPSSLKKAYSPEHLKFPFSWS